MTVAHAAANLVLFNTAGLCHPRQKTAEAPFCLEEAPRVMCAASRAIQVLQPDPVLRPSLAPTRSEVLTTSLAPLSTGYFMHLNSW